MRRIGKILAVAFLLTTMWSTAVQAAPDWFFAKVVVAGMVTPNLLVLRLTEVGDGFVRARFKNTTIPKEMLATALTAMAADIQVLVFVDPTQDFSEIPRLFLSP